MLITKENNNISLLLKLSVILLSLNIFASYMWGSDIALLIFIILVLIIYVYTVNNFSIKFNLSTTLWFFCALIFLISSLYSSNQIRGFNFSITFLCLVFITAILINCNDWQRTLVNSIFVFSGVHVAATLLYLFVPSFIKGICTRILTPEMIEINFGLIRYGANAGITGQTSTNAFFITMFIAISFSKLISDKKKKILYVILLFIGIFCLFITQKRGLLIANILAFVSVVIMLIFNNKSNKKRMQYLCLFALVIIVSFVILMNIPITYKVINKFIFTMKNQNFLTGRIDLYQLSYNQFLESPIFGKGIMSVSSLSGNDVHNIFLQLLAENGLLGFIFFLFTFLYNSVITFKTFKFALKNSTMSLNNSVQYITASLYIQIIFFIYGLVGNPLYDIRILTPYLLSVAIISFYYNKIQAMKKNTNESVIS